MLGARHMRFASLKLDFWELESGEARQAKYGEKFWLPDIELRCGLKVGQLVRLLFAIEACDEESGEIEVGVERMWVLVSSVGSDFYLGRLINQPAGVEPADDVYLSLGCEVPFRAEHVIDIHEWPEVDVNDFLKNAPYKSWQGAGA